jgi:CCR4-NOT transcription complex subunit 6
MYTQGHQGQHAAMMNGSQAHRGFAMQMPKFQHQTHHPHHPQPHHAHHNQASHQLNHQPSYTAGALASTTPHFTPSHMQNGTPAHVEDDIDESMNEHWQQQLQLAAEARQATSPHYYARTIAQQTKGIQLAPSQTDGTDNAGDNRPSAAVSKDSKRQGWTSLDFTSQGLRAISTALFNYRFLSKLYLSNNKLKSLPSSIGQLRSLTHLDLSGNDLTELPAEIGMLTNLRTLYAFDNHIQILPFEMGYLYRLEMLGIYGNPLNEVLSSQIKTHGTKALIKYLLEEMTGQWRFIIRIQSIC